MKSHHYLLLALAAVGGYALYKKYGCKTCGKQATVTASDVQVTQTPGASVGFVSLPGDFNLKW